jgi:hypothetical protein
VNAKKVSIETKRRVDVSMVKVSCPRFLKGEVRAFLSDKTRDRVHHREGAQTWEWRPRFGNFAERERWTEEGMKHGMKARICGRTWLWNAAWASSRLRQKSDALLSF